MRNQFTTVEEAEEWAVLLGVATDYAERLDLANFANELLSQLMGRFLPLPDQILIDAQPFRFLGRQAVQSPASANKGRIAINPDALYWNNPNVFAGMLRQQRFWSSDNVLHPLYHEAGHVLLYKADPQRFESVRDLSNAQKTVIAGEVSQRACRNVHEFVSEVFAGLMAERTFSRDVIRWYRNRGGVKL